VHAAVASQARARAEDKLARHPGALLAMACPFIHQALIADKTDAGMSGEMNKPTACSTLVSGVNSSSQQHPAV
jgi:hypothetical protein